MAMTASEFILGIDFGTSNSCAALWYPEGETEIIKIDEYEEMFPSCVFLNKSGKMDVGLIAEQEALSEPGRFRDKLKKDLLEDKPIFLGGKRFEAYKLVSYLLAYIKETAERNKSPINQVVLTVPAGYTKREEELMKKAAKEAGFSVIDTLTEPVAAAIYYTEKENNALNTGDCTLIYDFGGGTFDAAIIEKTDNGFKFPGVLGCLQDCGGTDIDILIYQKIISMCGKEFENRLQAVNSDDEVRLYYELFDVSRKRIKHPLTKQAEIFAMLPYGLPINKISITQAEFNQLIEPLVLRTLQCCEFVVSEAGKQTKDISSILLVGGSSVIPLVRHKLEKAFSCPVVLAKKPQMAVCQGAVLSVKATPQIVAENPPKDKKVKPFLAIPYNPNRGFF